ncbi:sulfotransferase domain-containing protein [Pseudohoeflea coraliihabitans]|uniref:Sulfotransferase domain-containing protein n=1 Tax=Pseudohoeflea coraliihabitans TaxID=2860393 RepID=A0ABS6WQV0_9HYPH|nr:sulfotransferase domain-containing protein [Pseudohoeflea sp. DP4N28-3]MBW3098344.1 sulfotransferase domain-containing protein [Pseudohoeflea sp. DP4N28-3]
MTQQDHTQAGIIWLASYPKSGNTWTRSFLFNLIAIMTGEDPSSRDINAVNERSIWDISARRYEEIIGKPPKEAGREAVAAARPRVQEAIADELPGISLVKTHNALVLDRGYPAINTKVTSGAVYILRNPLDVAISFAHHLGTTIDVAIERMGKAGLETPMTEETIHEIYGSWSENVLSWTRKPNPAIFVMRYEDMKRYPEKTFGALARHLLMNPTPAQLAEAIELSSFERMQKQEEETGFQMKPKTADKFFRKGQVDEWKEVLRRNQVRRIVRDHGQQMARFGYLPAKAVAAAG